MKLPKYVLYKGFTWFVKRLNGNQVTLHIIGFSNQHTLRWGVKALEAALADGTMQEDK